MVTTNAPNASIFEQTGHKHGTYIFMIACFCMSQYVIFAVDLICLIDSLFGLWINIVDIDVAADVVGTVSFVVAIDAVESLARFFKFPPSLRLCVYVWLPSSSFSSSLLFVCHNHCVYVSARLLSQTFIFTLCVFIEVCACVRVWKVNEKKWIFVCLYLQSIE